MTSWAAGLPGGKLGLALGGLVGAAFLDAKFYVSRDIKKIVAGVGMNKTMTNWDKTGQISVVERFIESVKNVPNNKVIVARDETGAWVSWTYAEVDKSGWFPSWLVTRCLVGNGAGGKPASRNLKLKTALYSFDSFYLSSLERDCQLVLVARSQASGERRHLAGKQAGTAFPRHCPLEDWSYTKYAEF